MSDTHFENIFSKSLLCLFMSLMTDLKSKVCGFYLFLHLDKNQYIGCLRVTIDVMKQHEEKQLVEGKGFVSLTVPYNSSS